MAAIADFFSRQKQIFRQQREIEKLQAELEKLRLQNESMRQGMRRCVSCDYRIDFKNRQGDSTLEN
jgi:cell division protein FtsB